MVKEEGVPGESEWQEGEGGRGDTYRDGVPLVTGSSFRGPSGPKRTEAEDGTQVACQKSYDGGVSRRSCAGGERYGYWW